MLDGYRADLERHLSRPDRPVCRECDGEGWVDKDSRDVSSGVMVAGPVECQSCEGTGYVPKE